MTDINKQTLRLNAELTSDNTLAYVNNATNMASRKLGADLPEFFTTSIAGLCQRRQLRQLCQLFQLCRLYRLCQICQICRICQISLQQEATPDDGPQHGGCQIKPYHSQQWPPLLIARLSSGYDSQLMSRRDATRVVLNYNYQSKQEPHPARTTSNSSSPAIKSGGVREVMRKQTTTTTTTTKYGTPTKYKRYHYANTIIQPISPTNRC